MGSGLSKGQEVAIIPNLIEVVNRTTAEAIKRIEGLEKVQGEKEMIKQEAIRDIVLATAEKVEALWNKVGVDEKDPKILQKYSNYFVKPLVDLLDLAQRSNVNVYEMKYGKKVQTVGKVEKFDDFVRRKCLENREKLKEASVIDITGIEEGKK